MKKWEPILEVRKGSLAEPIVAGGRILITPPLDEDFWLLRVRVSKKQAVVAFPKFMTLGIGFARETDWNTNLPWTCDTAAIFAHIKHNRGEKIPDARCLAAIELLQRTIREKNLDGVRPQHPHEGP